MILCHLRSPWRELQFSSTRGQESYNQKDMHKVIQPQRETAAFEMLMQEGRRAQSQMSKKGTKFLAEYSNPEDSEIPQKDSRVVDAPCRFCPSSLPPTFPNEPIQIPFHICYLRQPQLRSRWYLLEAHTELSPGRVH